MTRKIKDESDILKAVASDPSKKKSLVICVDFDGTIHWYEKWSAPGVFNDPIPGAVEAMQWLHSQGHRLIIFTCRGETEDIAGWLHMHSIPFESINHRKDQYDNCNQGKPVADIYIDDRAIQFSGDWNQTLDHIRQFSPWYKSQSKNAGEILAEAGKTFLQRNVAYGSSYKNHGELMMLLLPKGVELRTVEDFNRFGVFNMLVSKIYRYGSNFSEGGHPDSVHDLIVYSAILEELDRP